jgi:hypothetical protein
MRIGLNIYIERELSVIILYKVQFGVLDFFPKKR